MFASAVIVFEHDPMTNAESPSTPGPTIFS